MTSVQEKKGIPEFVKYSIYGAVFGLFFPVIGSFIQCYVQFHDFHFSHLVEIQKTSPLIWIIDSAPLFLGLFASFGGRQLDIVKLKNSEIQLKYEQMNHLRKLAEDANRTKSDFLANMSHEIRTPMNAIIGLSYLTLKTPLEVKQRENLLKIQKSSESLMGIINDILDFSKIEAGKLNIEYVNFNLEALINEVAELINVKLRKKKDIEFIIEYDNKIPQELKSDPLRIRQVLLNLLDNAVKFTEQGEIHLICTLKESVEKGVWINFSIRDNGIGISPEQKSLLFNAFQQADISTTRKFGGSGLGLTISKHLVEMMHGKLDVSSSLGNGSDFFFDLFLLRADTLKSKDLKRPQNLQGIRVLLVDDSESARSVIRNMLWSFGLHVIEASNADEAIKLYRKESKEFPISLIITDWEMPTKNGVEMLEELRREMIIESPSVLMVSAYGAEKVQLDRVNNNLIDEYLTKPVSPSVLFDTIQKTLYKNKFATLIGANNTSDIERYGSILKGKRILLVEDIEINAELAIDLLNDVGISVVHAANGQIAIDKLQIENFDAILMDIQMPVLDGLSATKKIRQLNIHAGKPIIAMTAHAMTGEREKSLAAGMNEHLSKPIDPKKLYQTLIDFLAPQSDFTSSNHEEFDINNHDLTDFPTVEGLDIIDGLIRCGRKKSLYNKILLSFANSYGSSLVELNMLITNREINELGKFFHALAGVSGNIGALLVSEKARSLSQSFFEESKIDTEELYNEAVLLVNQIEAIALQINTHYDNSLKQNIQNKAIMSKEELNLLILKIISLVEESDPSAVDLLNAALLNYAFGSLEPLIISVSNALGNLDFDEALIHLNKIKINE